MTEALTISGLKKTYQDFVLDGVSFSVPTGSIVGLIGENGAGKSTTIRAVLGLVQKETGTVSVLGKEDIDNDTKEQIGIVFDGNNFSEKFIAQEDKPRYEGYLPFLERTNIPATFEEIWLACWQTNQAVLKGYENEAGHCRCIVPQFKTANFG